MTSNPQPEKPDPPATPERPATAPGDPVQRRTVATLSLAQILVGVGVATGAATNSLIAAEMSGSATVGGIAQTAMVIGSALAALPIAQVAARHGRRRSLVGGYGVAALGALLATVATVRATTLLFLLGMVLIGAGSAAGLAARFAATDLAPPERRARALSVIVWAATAGSVVGPNLAGLLDSWALRIDLLPAARGSHSGVALALMAVMFAAAALVVAALLRPDPLLLARERAGALPLAPQRPWRSLRSGAGVVRRNPRARLGLLALVVSHFTMIAIMTMTPVHMDHHGADLRLIGLVISLHIAGMYVLSPLFGLATDRWGAVPVIVVGGTVLLAAALLVIGVEEHDWRLTVGLVLLGLGWSAGLVAGSALLAGVADEHRTIVQGTSDVSMNLGGALGGLVGGAVVAVADFGALAAVSAVLLLAYLTLVVATARRAGRSAVTAVP